MSEEDHDCIDNEWAAECPKCGRDYMAQDTAPDCPDCEEAK